LADDDPSLPDTTPRITRHVMPLGPRVLVRLLPSDDRTAGGLILPAGAKDATAEVSYAEVVEVARAAPDESDEGFGANVSGVPLGSRILFVKEKGLAVPWDDKLRIVMVKDVVALIEEFELDDVH
jgi:chaperonin GroES